MHPRGSADYVRPPSGTGQLVPVAITPVVATIIRPVAVVVARTSVVGIWPVIVAVVSIAVRFTDAERDTGSLQIDTLCLSWSRCSYGYRSSNAKRCRCHCEYPHEASFLFPSPCNAH